MALTTGSSTEGATYKYEVNTLSDFRTGHWVRARCGEIGIVSFVGHAFVRVDFDVGPPGILKSGN